MKNKKHTTKPILGYYKRKKSLIILAVYFNLALEYKVNLHNTIAKNCFML